MQVHTHNFLRKVPSIEDGDFVQHKGLCALLKKVQGGPVSILNFFSPLVLMGQNFVFVFFTVSRFPPRELQQNSLIVSGFISCWMSLFQKRLDFVLKKFYILWCPCPSKRHVTSIFPPAWTLRYVPKVSIEPQDDDRENEKTARSTLIGQG